MLEEEFRRSPRGLLGWTQRQLADAAGLRLAQIKNIERGALDPRASMLAAIEAAFAEHNVIFIEAGDSQSVPTLDHRRESRRTTRSYWEECYK
jgi:transcriptional regulator with XRE-family HTH domain